MAITEQRLDEIWRDLKGHHGGVREDYFGLLYLAEAHRVPTEQALNQVAFGGNDYGFDGFHLDAERRNLYLFQFKWSTSHGLFKESFRRLIDAGMDRIFGNSRQDQHQNQVLLQIHSRLLEDRELVKKVCIHFVFLGDPEEADRSQVLDKLREDLEGKKYLIDGFFQREVDLVCEFRSARTRKVGGLSHQKSNHTFKLPMVDLLERKAPGGESMHVGFIPAASLLEMYRAMGQRFFDRNIRFGLSDDALPNRAIEKALRQIVLDGVVDPGVFAFNHNGVTLNAERFVRTPVGCEITEPRLLNGAQTVSTLDRFLQKNQDHPRLGERKAVLSELLVPCKVISGAGPEFTTSVTINNNRQNPVMPWNLRANDLIQLELQDKFREDLGIYYERQESAFEALTQQDLDDLEISQRKALEIQRLAQTFLAVDGEVDKISRMKDVFGDDRMYDRVFHRKRLDADSRHILLCYKVQFRLRHLIKQILEKGVNKYAYMNKARNLVWGLLCQGMLNDDVIEEQAERYGGSLVVEADFTQWLAGIASRRVRFLIAGIVEKSPYRESIEEERYEFLRTRSMYDKCMEIAHRKWRWTQRKLQ